MDPEERACEGVFMAFQYPVEIPGVNNSYFLKAALNAQRKYRGEPELDAMDFLELVKDRLNTLHIDSELMKRPVNEGFSGGEKKRNEIFQMLVLQPTLAVLDETDSGLDIDALKTVAEGVNAMRGPDRAIVVVTHYQRLLNYIVPGLRARAQRGQDRQVGRQGTGARTRREGLRLARAGGGGMSQVVEQGTSSPHVERYVAAFEALKDRRPAGPAALEQARQAAIARFAALGFPTTADEEFRFTNVAPIAATPFDRAPEHTAVAGADLTGHLYGVGDGGRAGVRQRAFPARAVVGGRRAGRPDRVRAGRGAGRRPRSWRWLTTARARASRRPSRR